jgi:hypothetical protein
LRKFEEWRYQLELQHQQNVEALEVEREQVRKQGQLQQQQLMMWHMLAAGKQKAMNALFYLEQNGISETYLIEMKNRIESEKRLPNNNVGGYISSSNGSINDYLSRINYDSSKYSGYPNRYHNGYSSTLQVNEDSDKQIYAQLQAQLEARLQVKQKQEQIKNNNPNTIIRNRNKKRKTADVKSDVGGDQSTKPNNPPIATRGAAAVVPPSAVAVDTADDTTTNVAANTTTSDIAAADVTK